jgi:LPXTG-site transpeptidase (sortase) family protein
LNRPISVKINHFFFALEMKSKISSRWSWIILGIVGILCGTGILFSLNLAVSSQSAHAELASLAGGPIEPGLQQTSIALPIRLEIPEIKVNSALEYVGLTSQWAMAVPTGPMNAAWFYLGPSPGNVGSAVIAGHDGWKDNIPAVFDNLYKLRPGDKVYVEDANGAMVTFVVSKLQTYGQNQDASAVFASNDGGAHLNLITCEGTWNAITKSYSGRLVVFTDKIN